MQMIPVHDTGSGRDFPLTLETVLMKFAMMGLLLLLMTIDEIVARLITRMLMVTMNIIMMMAMTWIHDRAYGFDFV